MSFDLSQLLFVAPELTILVLGLLIMLADLWIPKEGRATIYWLSQTSLLIGALVSAQVLNFIVLTGQPRITVFADMVAVDVLGQTLKFFSCIGMAAALLLSRTYLQDRGLFRGEYFLLSLFALMGMLVMISANHLLVLYLGLELLSLSLYALVALQHDHLRSSEAAMKYFILGAVASGFLLYGMSMLYGATGSLGLEVIQQQLLQGHADHKILTLALVFIVSGIAFKLGAVPYHMWVPDVYEGSATGVTLIIAAVSKLAAFAFTLHLLDGALRSLLSDWQGMLMILAVLSMVVGNIVAIAQVNLKRMLAYSAISHMGFMLLGILTGNADGYSAALFYILVYMTTSLVGFGVILLLAQKGFEAEQITDYQGLHYRHPWYALILAMTMLSLAGIPVFVGFWAKLHILEVLVYSGFAWLAVVAVLSSLIGAFYYLRVVKTLYFDLATEESRLLLKARPDAQALLSILGLSLLLLGLAPNALLVWCTAAIRFSLY